MNNGWLCDLCGASSALFSHCCDLMRAFNPAHTKVLKSQRDSGGIDCAPCVTDPYNLKLNLKRKRKKEA